MTMAATPRRCTSSTSRLHRPLAAHAEKRTKDQLGLEERTASRKGDRSALRRRRVHCTTVGDSPDRGRAGRVVVLQGRTRSGRNFSHTLYHVHERSIHDIRHSSY